MDKNVLLSKIVATPTDTTWAQAYSTLNLYIVLSMKATEAQGSIVTAGKELFERMQREYFSLDEKNLANIKKSIEAAIAPVEDKNSISIVLTTISGNILYIIIVGRGAVILRRGEKVGPVATGVEGEIAAFSGEIRTDDVIILETEGFIDKVPVSKLQATLDSLSVTEISENLAPLILESSVGTEAAIILQYKSLTTVSTSAAEEEEVTSESEEQEEEKIVGKKDAEETQEEQVTEDIFETPPPKNKLPKISIPRLPNFGTKKIIILLILVLVIIFAGSIYYEKTRQETAKRDQALSDILAPEQKKFDEATSLTSLNKGLALDEFNTIQNDLSGKTSEFPQGTEQRKKLEEFIGQVQAKIGELSAGSTLANEKMIYDKGVDFVEFRGGVLAVVKADTGDLNILSEDGSSQKTVSTKNGNVTAINGDDTSIYAVGDAGVTKTDKKTGKNSNIIKDISNTIAVDAFGSNLYGLNSKTKTVDKYAGQEAPRSDYFKGSVTLSNPTSMSIDGSIWILDNGKVRKFTKGAEDSFSVSGLTKDIGTNAQIVTDSDATNVYILDKNTNRIIAIGKSDSTVKNQYVSKDLANASSFAVDEGGKKIFVVISGKLYSFDL